VYDRSTGKYPVASPEPIKVYFGSADSQYALMSLWGINNSAIALSLGLIDVRDCRVVDVGTVDV
jgi:hypothetical protein